ncbi:MAG: response regulator transcription factor [Ferruginibacter sp.]
MKNIRLAIVDDHQIVIDGLKSLLSGVPSLEMCGNSTDAANMLLQLQTISVDILLTDIMMEPMNGVELARKVRENYPNIKVLALSMNGEGKLVDEMIEGDLIQGYVLKNIGKSELITAIHKIAAGGIYYSEEVLKNLATQSEEKKTTEEQKFTAREVEIIKLIEKEKSNREIAAALFISERTVETHRKNIFRKLGSNSIIALVKYAYEHKLI